MARPKRFDLPDIPLHVVHRGNNRSLCFFGDTDRRFYLKCLAEASAKRGVAVHAYVLMANHVHMLVTPRKAGATAAMLQDVGRKYVRIINTIHGRTGTLWEGRYKSSVVAEDRYFLACHRYIELNPVRADIVRDPSEYKWSSYRYYAEGRGDNLISVHSLYTALGDTDVERRKAFRVLCSTEVDGQTLKTIREATNANWPIGREIPKRGRPSKSDVPAPESRNLF
jgi:REP-associated tyrosine transposase